MEHELEVKTEDSFGMEIAKAFAVPMAATAGMLAGLLLTGYLAEKIAERRRARKAEKTQEQN